MQLPVKAHYATLAMLALAARFESRELVSARSIAAEHGIPSQFLGQILQQLRTVGLIDSTRGANGGFSLQRAPKHITLLEIVDAICPLASGQSIEETSPFSRVVCDVWERLRETQREILAQCDLEQLLQSSEKGSPMFYI